MMYKGFEGMVTLDEKANIFYGEVINTRDVITFQGASLEECQQAFRGSVNDYLEFCRERGEEPDKSS
jgi:predicted HicB family RNase H-like nuclease